MGQAYPGTHPPASLTACGRFPLKTHGLHGKVKEVHSLCRDSLTRITVEQTKSPMEIRNLEYSHIRVFRRNALMLITTRRIKKIKSNVLKKIFASPLKFQTELKVTGDFNAKMRHLKTISCN